MLQKFQNFIANVLLACLRSPGTPTINSSRDKAKKDLFDFEDSSNTDIFKILP